MAKPFLLFARCSVDYSGRADSHLALGNYLIIRKADGSLLVHNDRNILPVNYLGKGAKVVYHEPTRTLVCDRKRETIKIVVERVIVHHPLAEWSDTDNELNKTESELSEYVFEHAAELLGVHTELVYYEYQTPLGRIDVLAVSAGDHVHIVETKRRTATLSACSQVYRYAEALREQGFQTTCYVASPDIAKTALAYLEKRGGKWLKVTFDGLNLERHGAGSGIGPSLLEHGH